MKDEQSYQEDWENEAPLLAKIPKKRPSGPPEGYFDAFPERLTARLKEMEAASLPEPGANMLARQAAPELPVVTRAWWQQTRVWAVAASVILLLAAGYLFWPFGNGSSVDADAAFEEEFHFKLASIDDSDILLALDGGDVSADDVFALLGADDKAQLEFNKPGQSDAMIDYLEDEDLEGLDISDLNIDPSELL